MSLNKMAIDSSSDQNQLPFMSNWESKSRIAARSDLIKFNIFN